MTDRKDRLLDEGSTEPRCTLSDGFTIRREAEPMTEAHVPARYRGRGPAAGTSPCLCAAPAADSFSPKKTAKGRLPPEVIQRVVRANFGRYRYCYEQGLADNPSLQGHVRVRFIIGADGAVTGTSDHGSDLPDPGAMSCIVNGFRELRLPEPEGGIVTVVYPIMFSPSRNDVGKDGCTVADEIGKNGARIRYRTCPPRTMRIIDTPAERVDDAFAARILGQFEQGAPAVRAARSTPTIAGRATWASVIALPGRKVWSKEVVAAHAPGRALVIWCMDTHATDVSAWCEQQIEKVFADPSGAEPAPTP
jgi:hypothetical protein